MEEEEETEAAKTEEDEQEEGGTLISLLSATVFTSGALGERMRERTNAISSISSCVASVFTLSSLLPALTPLLDSAATGDASWNVTETGMVEDIEDETERNGDDERDAEDMETEEIVHGCEQSSLLCCVVDEEHKDAETVEEFEASEE